MAKLEGHIYHHQVRVITYLSRIRYGQAFKSIRLEQKPFNRLLCLLIASAFLLTAVLGYGHYVSLHNWVIGDWLINYQAGFVRRGLTGELLFSLYQLTGLSPPLLTLFLQLSCYLIFLTVSFALVKNDQQPSVYLLLVASPFILFFQVMDPYGGFRKEILYIALLAVNCWSVCYATDKSRQVIFVVTMVLYPLLILSHEMLAVFMPILFIVHKDWLLSRSQGFKLVALLSIAVSCAAFLSALLFQGDKAMAGSICNSLGAFCPQGGAITWLQYGSDRGLHEVTTKVLSTDYLTSFAAMVLLSGLAYLPIKNRLRPLLCDPLNWLFLLPAMAGTLVLMLFAVDWGRFLYIWCVTFFLLSFLFADKKAEQQPAAGMAISVPYVILLLAYFLSWRMGHYYGELFIGHTPIFLYQWLVLTGHG